MERVAFDVDALHLVVRDRDALGIGVGIKLAAHGQAGVGGCRADQINDDAVAHQRLATPVHRDEREQPMLDSVPLCALPRRIDVVGANPTRQLSLQPEAPGADQEATNGLKHFGKRSLWGSAGHTGRSTSEHQRGLERINVRADPPVERAGRRRQASERDTPLTVSPG